MMWMHGNAPHTGVIEGHVTWFGGWVELPASYWYTTDGLEEVVLEAVWLKHDGNLRRRATLRGRLGHAILLHLVDRCFRGTIRCRKTRRDAALPCACAGGHAQPPRHIPTPVSCWQDSGRRILEAGLSRARWYGR